MVSSSEMAYCSQGVTLKTQDPNVLISHIQVIVLGF